MTQVIKYSLVVMTLGVLMMTGACDKGTPDAGTVAEDGLHSIHLEYGQNQEGLFNTLLTDSVVFKVTNRKGKPVRGAMVYFQAQQGETLYNYGITDSLGHTYCFWNAGCEEGTQKMTAYLSDATAHFIDSIGVTSRISAPLNFGKSCVPRLFNQKKIACLPSSDRIFMVGDDDPYVYVSTNSGISWDIHSQVPFATGYDAILLQEDGDLFVVSEDGFVWRMNSQGGAWHMLKSGMTSCFTISSVNNEVLILSIYGYTYRSVDNGDHWTLIEEGYFNDVAVHELYVHPDGTIYRLDGWDNIQYSNDWGDTWQSLTYYHPFRMDPKGNMYAVQPGWHDRKVLISRDKGQTWTDHVYLPPAPDNKNEILQMALKDEDVYLYGSDMRLYHFPANQNVIYFSELLEAYLYPEAMWVTPDNTVGLLSNYDIYYSLQFK